jgi:hypothetical protein
MPGANPNLGSFPGRITNAQQAQADARVAANTAASKNKVAPNESAAETNRLKNSKPIVASPNIVRKTTQGTITQELKQVTVSRQKVVSAKAGAVLNKPRVGENVLNAYRSFNYNFTLSALKFDALDDPESYRQGTKDYTILKSGGKGAATLKPTGVTDSQAIKLIKKFNEESPGRFDMFIDNVEIETTMAFGSVSGVTLPTTIRFDVFEPYSINGFIEAVHVAAVAAGYVNYTQASFMLKMDFMGFPEGEGMPELVKSIPKSTRYFVFKFTGIELDITEQGAKYKCTGVPFEQSNLADTDNKLHQSIQVQGTKVGNILENFVKTLTEQRAAADNLTKSPTSNRDVYTIEFPSWVAGKGFDSSVPNKKIVDKPFTVTLRENAIYVFEDPQTTTKPNAYRTFNVTNNTSTGTELTYEANGPTVVSFSQGQNITDCIAAVIADSHYTRDLLDNLQDYIDDFGMVDYFMIKLIVTNQGVMNNQKKRFYQNTKFVVTPWKIHYTKIPNYQDQSFSAEQLDILVLRQYNYIYTGDNVDVLSFKLQFNTLFYDAMSNAMANSDRVSAQTSAATQASSQVGKNYDDGRANYKTTNPVAATAVDSRATSGYGDVPAGQQQQDPYAALAKAMHHAITHSNSTGQIQAEIDILGDPFFLATGGIGNFSPKPENGKPGETSDGEAFHNYGMVLVRVNFQNPEDINTLENGGLAKFNKGNKVAFSGVYFVTQVSSTFRQGVFKQRLMMTRLAQNDKTTFGTTEAAKPPAAIETTTPSPENTPTAPTQQLAELTAGLKKIDETQRMLSGAYSKVESPVAKDAIQKSIIQNAEARAAALKQIDALKKLKLTGG